MTGGLRTRLVVDCSRAVANMCSARTAAVVPVRFSSAGRIGTTALALDATVDPIGEPGGGGGNLGAVCTVGGGFPTAEDLGEVIGGVYGRLRK